MILENGILKKEQIKVHIHI